MEDLKKFCYLPDSMVVDYASMVQSLIIFHMLIQHWVSCKKETSALTTKLYTCSFLSKWDTSCSIIYMECQDIHHSWQNYQYKQHMNIKHAKYPKE